MDYGAALEDSFEYAKEALWGKWVRWLIFIILSLPFALIPFVFDPEKLTDGKEVHWELVAWDQIALLVVAGFFLSFFVSGYLVRIYRGEKPAPDFEKWGSLFVDGIKICIVWLLWFLPLLVVFMAGIAVAIVSYLSLQSDGAPNITALLMIIPLLIIGFILFVIAILYGLMGAIRFSRTGSIREGIRFGQLTELIRSIGWGAYILALVVAFVASIVFFIVTAVLSAIPWIGWVIQLVLTPVYSIFIARYTTLIYEQGEPKAAETPVVQPEVL